ncbi:hypothetical protein UB51_12705 [Paenibacillus sp. IHBB 10380]|nr:hypothetical protein UB51_12705 [Paenibacillus sp. IHBB 10380]
MRYARKSEYLTIRELATKTGLTPEAISMMERNTHPPSLSSLRKISIVLKKPIHFLGCYEDMNEETLGDQIKKARYYKGLTLEEAGEHFGADVKTIRSWETNRRRPSNRHINEVKLFVDIIVILKL